jgi:hypothetical protein
MGGGGIKTGGIKGCARGSAGGERERGGGGGHAYVMSESFLTKKKWHADTTFALNYNNCVSIGCRYEPCRKEMNKWPSSEIQKKRQPVPERGCRLWNSRLSHKWA